MLRLFLGTLPAAFTLLLLCAGGLLFAAAQSFGLMAVAGGSEFTVRHYAAVLGSKEYQASLWLTFRVAALSTALSAMSGAVLAVSVHRLMQRTRRVSLLLQIPVAVPHLAIGLAAIHLLAPAGLLARALCRVGILGDRSDMPALTGDAWGAGIIFVYLLKETPFLALLCLTVLLRTDPGYAETARTLGATALQRFRHVTAPVLTPVLAAGSVLVFAFVFSAFEVPFLLGRPYPAMLGVVAQRKFLTAELMERPEALAVAMLMAAVPAALLAAAALVRLMKADAG